LRLTTCIIYMSRFQNVSYNLSLYVIKCFLIICEQKMCFRLKFPSFLNYQLKAKCWFRAWPSVSESILCFCHKCFWVLVQFHIVEFRVYLVASVKDTNSSVGFGVHSVTLLNTFRPSLVLVPSKPLHQPSWQSTSTPRFP
jgi:hypothetical protein